MMGISKSFINGCKSTELRRNRTRGREGADSGFNRVETELILTYRRMDYFIHVPIMSEVFRPVDWIHSSNIYEVNLRQYTPEGTIAAFARQMPRLREMGIDILWFMPITPISHDHRLGSLGSYYACSDYTAINPEYGTLDDFIQLVKEAHALGFKAIIDI